MKIAVIANTRESFLAICKKYEWQPDIEACFIDTANKAKTNKPEIDFISIDEMAPFVEPDKIKEFFETYPRRKSDEKKF